MNICFLEGDMSHRGGTERITAELANQLSKIHGNNVSIISLRMIYGEVFFPLEPEVTHTVLSPASRRLGILRHIREIHRYIKKHNIDIIINVDIGMGIYGIFASKGTKAKVITTEHSIFFNDWGSRYFKYFRRIAVKYSDALVVLTEQDREAYTKNMPSKTPVIVITNPVERHDFKYDDTSKTILSAGALVPIKRFDNAVEAGVQIFAKHPDWKWIICGEGPELENLKKQINDAGLQNNIFLPGTAENMRDYYKSAAMAVVTSEFEGLSMVLLEAKSYGLPLVSYDIMAGPRDIIASDLNGFLVESGNTQQLAEKICTLIENEELRLSFSANSQFDMDKFDMKTIMSKWKKLLGDLSGLR